jgi:hypothetical protein
VLQAGEEGFDKPAPGALPVEVGADFFGVLHIVHQCRIGPVVEVLDAGHGLIAAEGLDAHPVGEDDLALGPFPAALPLVAKEFGKDVVDDKLVLNCVQPFAGPPIGRADDDHVPELAVAGPDDRGFF